MIATLERYAYLPNATLARLKVAAREYHTVERPWRSNRRNQSCIPEGFFECRRVDSPRFGNTFEIVVPGRSHILFHAANYAHELEGCIAPGLALMDGQIAVRDSRLAMELLLEQLDGRDGFRLHVYQYQPRFHSYDTR